MISTKVERFPLQNYNGQKQSTKTILLFSRSAVRSRTGCDRPTQYAAITCDGFSLDNQRDIEFDSFMLQSGFDIKSPKLPENLIKTKFVVVPDNGDIIIHSTLPIGREEKTEFRITCSAMPGVCHFDKNDRYSIKIKIGQAF